ncbi:DUF6898 family protein [Parapedomonas caeni]|jgi:hypothetical protein
MPTDDDQGYFIEFTPIGNAVKVSAVDPLTGLEVSIVGPATAAHGELARLAARKLDRALGRGAPDHTDVSGGDASSKGPAGRRGGIIV